MSEEVEDPVVLGEELEESPVVSAAGSRPEKTRMPRNAEL
jgi:hypothetical protein